MKKKNQTPSLRTLGDLKISEVREHDTGGMAAGSTSDPAGGSADHGDGSQPAGAGRGAGRAAVIALFSVMLVQSLSRVNSWIPWTVGPQAPLSMGFSRNTHWSGYPFPSPGDLPDPGIKAGSLAL